jgi:hypothetical protein
VKTLTENITTEDVGMTTGVGCTLGKTRDAGLDENREGGSGDPSPFTALGTYMR